MKPVLSQLRVKTWPGLLQLSWGKSKPPQRKFPPFFGSSCKNPQWCPSRNLEFQFCNLHRNINAMLRIFRQNVILCQPSNTGKMPHLMLLLLSPLCLHLLTQYFWVSCSFLKLVTWGLILFQKKLGKVHKFTWISWNKGDTALENAF